MQQTNINQCLCVLRDSVFALHAGLDRVIAYKQKGFDGLSRDYRYTTKCTCLIVVEGGHRVIEKVPARRRPCSLNGLQESRPTPRGVRLLIAWSSTVEGQSMLS
jgi:hypothetical protein